MRREGSPFTGLSTVALKEAADHMTSARMHLAMLLVLLTATVGSMLTERLFRRGEGTLLDSSMVAFGSPIRDGNAHDPKNVPIVVAGGSKAGMKTGKHVVFDQGTPLCGLWISMLETAGVKADKLGDADDGLRGVS